MLYHLIITLPMLVCLFWGIFFFFRYALHSAASNYSGLLTIFYIMAFVLYANHWMYFSDHPSFVGEWTYSIANLCVYPIFYAYLRALTRTGGKKEIIGLLIPAAIIAVLFPIAHFGIPELSTGVYIFVRICFAFQVVWVWLRGVHYIRLTQRRMDDTYSDNRSWMLRPIHILLQLFGITAAASTLLNIMGREFFAEGLLVGIPAIIMTLLLYGLGYCAAHTFLPAETVEDEALPEQPATNEESDELMMRIDQLMREKLLYTNSGLTIADVASAVNSNRTYVSNSINRTYGISFSQYIAQQRVEYAKLILRDTRYKTDHEAIVGAITLSGFMSDQSFYRAFKDLTGLTPLQYRHQNQA